MVNSRNKGKRAELQLANLLRDKYGFKEARRGVQYSGINGDADVVGCPNLHIEVKAVEKLNIENAMEQSMRDAREDEIPIVVHKRNRKPWLVTLNLENFMPLYISWERWNNGNKARPETTKEDKTRKTRPRKTD